MSIKAEPSFSLKDQLFNEESVTELATSLRRAHRRFDRSGYVEQALVRFPELELKERIHWLATLLDDRLPADFDRALAILEACLPEPLDPTKRDDDFGQFIWVVPGEYVARHGCTRKRLSASLAFLREATKRFSSESAIRPFLAAFPEETLNFMRRCAVDDNYHVRRWASEGIRPLLPWAQRVVLPSQDIVAILDLLHADRTRYVTRSVANAMNDLSKSDPALVIGTFERWIGQGKQSQEELAWMTRHALRTLLKNDEPDALRLLGYSASPAFKVTGVKASKVVAIGSDFTYEAQLASQAEQKLKLSLRVEFLKANGRHAPKIFAVGDLSMRAGEKVSLVKRVKIKPITTRAHYLGRHYAQLVINGVATKRVAFELVDGD